MIIDAHAHLDFSTKESMMRDFDRYRSTMDGVDLRGTMLMGGSVDTIDFFPENERLIELSQQHRWIFPIVNFDPPQASRECLRAIEQWIDQGHCYAVKLYPGYDPFYPAEDPWCRELCAVLVDRSVPLIIHTGDTFTSYGRLRYSHPLNVDDVAVDNPSLSIVFAHIGMPFGETATALLRKNPLVHSDGSGLFYSDEYDAEEVFLKELKRYFFFIFAQIRTTKKIHFGGDFPFTNPLHHVMFWQDFFRDFPDPDEATHRFFFENARSLFKLPLEG